MSLSLLFLPQGANRWLVILRYYDRKLDTCIRKQRMREDWTKGMEENLLYYHKYTIILQIFIWHYSNCQDSLNRKFSSIRADTFNRTRSIRTLGNVVGVSPLWTIWTGAGRPFSWSTTVLGEEGAHKCRLPLHGRVILGDRSRSRDNCLSIILDYMNEIIL